MTAAQVHREIDRVRRELSQVEEHRAHSATALARALGVSFPDASAARATMAQADTEMARLREKIADLEAHLPPPAQLAAARASLVALEDRATGAVARHASATPRFRAALEVAEAAARDLATARAESATAVAQMSDLARDTGLAVSVPAMFAPPESDTVIVRHLAMLLRDVAEGGTPDPTLELYLADARRHEPRVGSPG